MRYFSLVEQSATYTHGTTSFTVGALIPGRRDFTTLVTEAGERFYYHAETADKSQWELGIGTWDGSSVFTRANVLRSSNFGFGINFTTDVVLALVQPSDSMLVIDSSDPTTTAQAHGDEAMAAGPSSKAWGAQSTAIGKDAVVGSSGTPVTAGLALGYGARGYHDGATALGAYAYTIMPYAAHGFRSVLWSGEGSTSGAVTNDLQIVGIYPSLPTDSVLALEALVVARNGTDAYSAVIRALVRRGSSGDAVIVGSPSVTEIAKSGGVTVSATVVARTGGEFAIRVTGAASQNWSWAGSIHGVSR